MRPRLMVAQYRPDDQRDLLQINKVTTAFRAGAVAIGGGEDWGVTRYDSLCDVLRLFPARPYIVALETGPKPVMLRNFRFAPVDTLILVGPMNGTLPVKYLKEEVDAVVMVENAELGANYTPSVAVGITLHWRLVNGADVIARSHSVENRRLG